MRASLARAGLKGKASAHRSAHMTGVTQRRFDARATDWRVHLRAPRLARKATFRDARKVHAFGQDLVEQVWIYRF